MSILILRRKTQERVVASHGWARLERVGGKWNTPTRRREGGRGLIRLFAETQNGAISLKRQLELPDWVLMRACRTRGQGGLYVWAR